MNISGISSYWGFYDYNSIKSEKAGKADEVSEPEARQHELQSPPEEETERVGVLTAERLEQSADYAQAFTGADYAGRYQPDFEYEPGGENHDINQLDVTRAISDMQKDQVLLQYQFFVGGSRSVDGVKVLSDVNPAAIREMEDFAL